MILDLLTLALPLFSQKRPQESIWRLCQDKTASTCLNSARPSCVNCTHCNTEMEREERSRGLPFSAERHSQDEMRRRENLQQRVVEAERRAQEESRRAGEQTKLSRERGRWRESVFA